MDFNNLDLCGCKPIQIVNINLAINKIDDIKIYDNCNNVYDMNTLQYAYSVDMLCWSCYLFYNDLLTNIAELHTDFYIRIKVQGDISKIELNNSQFLDYTTQLDSSFNFTYCNNSTSSNIYNPYANMDCAIGLYQNLSETVACITGIPIYYFKLSPNTGSKDITFKEYTLMDVASVKQIKLIVKDGQMPSSKPEFNDWGLDWQTDWETEISKSMFATAFGPTAQPMEGDLIYIPMMKRMWMVNEAYEEKRDGFMWVATTFKVTLVKYQEKGSVDLGSTEDLVSSFVKNKYEDLFGDDNEDTNGSGEEFTNGGTLATQDNLIPIYESDAQRKYISVNSVESKDEATYYKGTVISDKFYNFTTINTDTQIVYQQKYCSTDGTCSFIIKPIATMNYNGDIIKIGNLKIQIKQTPLKTILKVNKSNKLKLELENNQCYFIFLRWSKQLKIVEFSSSLYTYPQSIPIYKLQSGHYYYDIDNKQSCTDIWNIEFSSNKKVDVSLHGFLGNITNIKLFNSYNDNISEILQMYPTNNTLIINDTARNILGADGIRQR